MKLNSFHQTKGLKVIGRGAFTRCYDNGDNVLLVSSCPVKECIAHGWGSDSALFPTIEQLDYQDESRLYTMKKYSRTRSLKTDLRPDQYELYKNLVSFARQWQLLSITLKRGDHRHMEFIKLAKSSSLDESTKQALIEQADGLANYTNNIGFEVSPRNVAADNGNLILLDVFFSVDQLIKTRSK